ncbi:hypothetical protein BSKO_02097 [Bryopsis sp. KO-2023]|nr:hypothetical protein BSKO_02097 [Bryopsis sp. KO-2023]
MHPKRNEYIPQLLFTELLSSSDCGTDAKENGCGAKLTNIFSNEFTIESSDPKNMKKYRQTFAHNMTVKNPPIITDIRKKEAWTKVTFEPDLSRFSLTRLDEGMVDLIRKRTYDMAGVLGGKKTKVYFNGARIKVNNFQEYLDLYLGPRSLDKPRVYERLNDCWEVCVAPSDGDTMQQVAFVNSICTSRGGSHVHHVLKQISDKLVKDAGQTTREKGCINPARIRNRYWVFLNCWIDNPWFDSQTKDILVSHVSTFGSRCEITDKFMKKLEKSGILDAGIEPRGKQTPEKTVGKAGLAQCCEFVFSICPFSFFSFFSLGVECTPGAGKGKAS